MVAEERKTFTPGTSLAWGWDRVGVAEPSLSAGCTLFSCLSSPVCPSTCHPNPLLPSQHGRVTLTSRPAPTLRPGPQLPVRRPPCILHLSFRISHHPRSVSVAFSSPLGSLTRPRGLLSVCSTQPEPLLSCHANHVFPSSHPIQGTAQVSAQCSGLYIVPPCTSLSIHLSCSPS